MFRNSQKWLLAVGVFWTIVVGGVVALQEFKLETGREVTLKVVPVDPFDMFRGEYVQLSYEITRLPLSALDFSSGSVVPGKTVYVLFREAAGQGNKRIFTAPPKGQDFIRGTVRYVTPTDVFIDYGIEQYFVPEGRGKELELNRDNALSTVVVIDESGQARIKQLLLNGKPFSRQE